MYDRFGRLIHGSKTVAKDVLEYVVFEKHLANVYGSWRLHAKIIPDWMEAKPGSSAHTDSQDWSLRTWGEKNTPKLSTSKHPNQSHSTKVLEEHFDHSDF